MARKIKNENLIYSTKFIKDFTRNIHSTRRTGTRFAGMDNWNEKAAKEGGRLSCKECRQFVGGCSMYVGRWHKPCEQFQWD
jgi:hypothetical protein